MEAGSSPARTTSSRTGTPRSLSPATSEATSERTSAAAVLPSSIFATSPLEDREQHGGHLLFAAHHALQVLQGVHQLVFALEEACADDLHLGDANLVSRARPVLLRVAADDLFSRERRDIRGGLEHLRSELVRVKGEHLLEVSSDLAIAVRGGRRVQDHRVREKCSKQHLCG